MCLEWQPGGFKATGVHITLGTAVARDRSHGRFKGLNQVEDVPEHPGVGEGGGDDSLEAGGGGVIHVEQLGGGEEAGAGGVTKTVNGQPVVENHLLDQEIIENHQRIA